MPRSSAKGRILAFLLANLATTVSQEELRGVGGTSEWARRLRELRENEGYKILSHHDDPMLGVGEYRLDDPVPTPRFGHKISARLRLEILQRNHLTCRICGLGQGDDDPMVPGRKVRLQVDHIDPNGQAVPENLRTLCSACNLALRNHEVAPQPMPARQRALIAELRTAAQADKEAVFDWLRQHLGH